jgi:hypothetical protein
MSKDYESKHYSMKMCESVDELSVVKFIGSDWCSVKMVTNGRDNGEILIRSKEMAESLLFMLKQLLDE